MPDVTVRHPVFDFVQSQNPFGRRMKVTVFCPKAQSLRSRQRFHVHASAMFPHFNFYHTDPYTLIEIL